MATGEHSAFLMSRAHKRSQGYETLRDIGSEVARKHKPAATQQGMHDCESGAQARSGLVACLVQLYAESVA